MSEGQGTLDLEFDTRLEAIFSELRAIVRDQYSRGNREALAKIAHLANSSYDQSKAAANSFVTGERVPRGSSRAMVERVLQSGAKTITEIRRAATTDIERALSYQTIRLELLRGTKERRYKKIKDKWSIAKIDR